MWSARFDRPNGLAFSPDEETIYIADSSPRRHARALDLEKDGTLTNNRTFAEIHSKLPGNPDSMKVNTRGDLFVSTAGGIWMCSKEGKRVATIKTQEVPANCAGGDNDWKTLYITARTYMCRIRLNIPGMKLT